MFCILSPTFNKPPFILLASLMNQVFCLPILTPTPTSLRHHIPVWPVFITETRSQENASGFLPEFLSLNLSGWHQHLALAESGYSVLHNMQMCIILH